MTTKFGGITLTDKQVATLRAVLEGTAESRKVITMYKAGDEGLALFRVQAGRLLIEIAARGVARRPLTAKHAKWVNSWIVDANPMVRDHLAALNKALGYEFIQGVSK